MTTMISIPQGQREAAARSIKTALTQIKTASRNVGQAEAAIREIHLLRQVGCNDATADQRIACWQEWQQMSQDSISRWEETLIGLVDHFMVGEQEA